MSTEKKYRLLDTEKTIPEWCAIFPFMWGRDFEDDGYGFEPVTEPSAPETKVKALNISFESNTNLLKVFINKPVNEVVADITIDKLLPRLTEALNDTSDDKANITNEQLGRMMYNIHQQYKAREDAMMEDTWKAARLASPIMLPQMSVSEECFLYKKIDDYKATLPLQQVPIPSKNMEQVAEDFVRQSKPMEEKDVVCQRQTYDTTVKDKREWKICAIRNKEGILWYTDMMPKQGEAIEAVERLSDNTVFSIGDKVNCDKCPESFSQQTIEKFQIADKGFMIASCAGVATSINNISKLPTPNPEDNTVSSKTVLFTTEDGVDIREDDKYWKVDNFSIRECVGANYTLYREMYKEDGDGTKRFSTKEAAEQYILENKPCLSLSEIMSLLGEGVSWYAEQKIRKAIKLKQ